MRSLAGWTGDFRNEVGPAMEKWAAPDLEALADRCHTGKLGGRFDAKPDAEHLFRRGQQVNVNLKSAIPDCSLHKDLPLLRPCRS